MEYAYVTYRVKWLLTIFSSHVSLYPDTVPFTLQVLL